MRIARVNRTWTIGLGIVLAAWSTVAAAEACSEGQIGVETQGFAGVIGDVGAALDEARRDALRWAVEEAAGVVMQSSTLIVNFELVEDELRVRSEGYVATHSVIDQEVDESSVRVLVHACVDPRELRADLETFGVLLREQLGNPRLVVRTEGGEGGSADVARRLLEHHFAHLGFDVRRGGAAPCSGREDLSDVEVIICVQAATATTPTGVGRDLYTSRATVDLEAVLSSTSQVVVRKTNAAGGEISLAPEVGEERVLERALAPLLDGFTQDLIRELNVNEAGVATLELIVHGLPDFEAYSVVASFLRTVRGVQHVEARALAEGRGTFSVLGSASAGDVARRLQAFTELELRVTRVEAHRVEADVVP